MFLVFLKMCKLIDLLIIIVMTRCMYVFMYISLCFILFKKKLKRHGLFVFIVKSSYVV